MSSNTKTISIHVLLFVATLITTTLSGAEWMFGNIFFWVENPLGLNEFLQGFHFSIPFLAVLTIHEFGHYFVAKKHQIEVTLPYYIPFWFGLSQSIGTLGAFIKIKSVIRSRKTFFDIGIAGPLAGFVAALVLLTYGFTHLPSPDHIFTIHPEYKNYGSDYAQYVYANQEGTLALGDNLLFWLFKNYVADPSLMPNQYEIIHYPYLFAGFLSLFFTALNLLPIGQLDGGHILYGLIGKKRFDTVSRILFILFTFYAGLGLFKLSDFAVQTDESYLYQLLYLVIYFYFLFTCFRNLTEQKQVAIITALSVIVAQFTVSFIQPEWEGYSGFLAFIFILGRFLGVYHPQTSNEEPLDKKRIILGIISLIIFVLCFSPKPFILS